MREARTVRRVVGRPGMKARVDRDGRRCARFLREHSHAVRQYAARGRESARAIRHDPPAVGSKRAMTRLEAVSRAAATLATSSTVTAWMFAPMDGKYRQLA